jgi:hypothetical protein
VLTLGDLISHDDWLLSEDIKAANNQYVIDQLREHFWDGETIDTKSPDSPVILPVVGNHEGHPVDYDNYDDPNGFMKTRIFKGFESVIGVQKVKDLSTKGFYTFKDPNRKIKFLSINSNVNNLFNSYSSASPSDPMHILNEIAHSLYESENKGERVIILTHIPLIDDSSLTVFSRYFKLLLNRFHSIISCSLAAHTHNDQLRFYQNENQENIMMEFISPSLTTYEGLNPGFRVYQFAGSGEFRDYVQFKFNIDVMNMYARQGDFRFEYQQSYGFVDEYSIQTKDFWSRASSETGFNLLGNVRQKKKFMDEIQDKILNDIGFTKVYLRHFFTWYKIDLGYTELTTKIEQIRCLTKDDVETINNCIASNGGNFSSLIGSNLYRFIFEKTNWIVPINKNPFVDDLN